jgi:hypothetical protein
MSCSPPFFRAHSRRHHLVANQERDPVELDGTWDFKWRKSSAIRIAFQVPPNGDPAQDHFEKVIPRVIDLAARWQTSVRYDFERAEHLGKVHLNLHFLSEKVAPPAAGWVGWRQLPKVALKDAVRYDVLISLATLPVTIVGDSKRSDETIVLPRSEFGRYARRLEYGLPSGYLGVFRPGTTLLEFSKTQEWEHIVVHEFGHILGLAHPYQQHNAKVGWTDDQLRRLIPKFLGLKFSDKALEDHIDQQYSARLPAPAENEYAPIFSDEWENPSAESVMNPFFAPTLEPKFDGSLPGAGATRSGAKDGRGEASSFPGPWLDKPTNSDLAHLRSMY